MARRKSIPDRVRAGRSRIVPYRRGESFKQRHARRLDANLEQEVKVREWCRQRGLTLRITNEGHHWQITQRELSGRVVAVERQARDRQMLASRNSLS